MFGRQAPLFLQNWRPPYATSVLGFAPGGGVGRGEVAAIRVTAQDWQHNRPTHTAPSGVSPGLRTLHSIQVTFIAPYKSDVDYAGASTICLRAAHDYPAPIGTVSSEQYCVDIQVRPFTMETTWGQIHNFCSQLPFKCYLPEIASVGDLLEICPWVASRAGLQRLFKNLSPWGI